MAIYDNTYPPNSIAPGETYTMLNAEHLGAGTFSQRVAIQDVHGMQARPVLVTFAYTSVPPSVQYDIYVAWDDTAPLTSYTKVGSTTNVNGDQVTLNRAAAGGNHFRFLCVREVVSPSPTANATVKVSQ